MSSPLLKFILSYLMSMEMIMCFLNPVNSLFLRIIYYMPRVLIDSVGSRKIQTLRDMQVDFQKHTGVRDYSAVGGISPGICHQVAREEFIDVGDFIQATDSHTCMGGASNALSYGVGSTEYANLVHNQFSFVSVPESIRFNLVGELHPGCTAKDIILHILWKFAQTRRHWIGVWNSEDQV